MEDEAFLLKCSGAGVVLSKHEKRTQETRRRLLDAAEALYGNHSIDATSFGQITRAAGQKNSNALQYHFEDRAGLLQAIVDRHSSRIALLRERYFHRAEAKEWSPAEAAARCFVMPVTDYVRANPAAVNFVKIISQLSALNRIQVKADNDFGVVYPEIPKLRSLLDAAMSHLPEVERNRRIFLIVNMVFHGVADIYRSAPRAGKGETAAMIEQLVCALESFLAAPSRRRAS